MSGTPRQGAYASLPMSDTSVPGNPISYPPPPSSATAAGFPRPGPAPLNPYNQTHVHRSSAGGSLPGSAAIDGSYELYGTPPRSSASGTFNYSDSPKPNMSHVSLPSLEQHDFAPLKHEPSHRWSWDSVTPPGMKRGSRAWWKYKWRVQVSRRKLPRLLYGITGLILLAVWISVAASFASNIEYSEAANSDLVNSNSTNGEVGQSGVLFFLSGALNSFDPQQRNLNIDWSALMVQGPLKSTDLSQATVLPVESFGTSAIAMWRDQTARPDTVRNATELGYVPYRVKNPNIKPTGFLGINDFDQINTDIGLGQKSSSIYSQPEFGYPFDVFKGQITWVAADNDTITALKEPGAAVVRMQGAILTDSLLNLKIRSSTNATCLDASIVGCELIIDIWAERTGLVKFTVIAVFIINWVVTIAIFLVTGEALLLNRKDILEGTDILAVCFTALFALPTVRSLLPGAPDVGCLLDVVGILPCVIVITLCTVFFTNSRLRMKRHQRAEEAALAAEQAATKAN